MSSVNGISDLTHSESMKQTQDAIVTISPPYLQSSAPAPPQLKGKNYALWNSSCSDSGNSGLQPRHKPFNLLISAFQILTECFSLNTEHNNIHRRTKTLDKICCGHLLSETDVLLILFYHCLMSRSYQILVSCKTSRRHNNWGSRNASELVAAGRLGQALSWPARVAAGVSL